MPCGVSVSNISTSAIDRFNQLLNGTLDDSIRAPVDRIVLRDCTDASALSNETGLTTLARAVSQAKLIPISLRSDGASRRPYWTAVGVIVSGSGSHCTRSRRRI